MRSIQQPSYPQKSSGKSMMHAGGGTVLPFMEDLPLANQLAKWNPARNAVTRLNPIARRSNAIQVTAKEFRELALSFPDAVEAAHVGHPDFRVRGKIFATLGYPDDSFGVLMLTPDEQHEAIGRYPEVFEPVAGGWGRRGNTHVRLNKARPTQLRPWMELAWNRIARKKPR